MYQIRNDGVPVVDNDGFEWDGGRRTWLHPGQSYGLNVSFSEVNGFQTSLKLELLWLVIFLQIIWNLFGILQLMIVSVIQCI